MHVRRRQKIGRRSVALLLQNILSQPRQQQNRKNSTQLQVCQPNGEVVITNDGATILNRMTVTQPAAKMLVELARSQDAAAGDGTTSVTVICGALLTACLKLLERGMHPTVVSDGFARAAEVALEAVESLAIPVDLADREELAKAASTSLQSKVVSQHAALLAPMAVDCVLKGTSWYFLLIVWRGRKREGERVRKGERLSLFFSHFHPRKNSEIFQKQKSNQNSRRPGAPRGGRPPRRPRRGQAGRHRRRLRARRRFGLRPALGAGRRRAHAGRERQNCFDSVLHLASEDRFGQLGGRERLRSDGQGAEGREEPRFGVSF